MKDNTISDEKIKYIENHVYEQIKKYIISSKDLYLTIAGTIGKIGIIPEKFNNMNLTENAVKLCNININKYIVLYFLQSAYIQNIFNNKTNKVAQPKLAITRIEKTLFPLPPNNEQVKIINKIEKILSYIKEYDIKNNKLNLLNISYKEELKKSILQYAIQGKLIKQNINDESAEVLINKILDEKRELIKTKQIKKENLSVIYKDDTDNQFYEKFDDGRIVNITDEIPFDIPNNWAWTRLENLTTKQIKRGKSPKYVEKSNIYVFAQKCNPKNGIITLENAKFLDETTLKKYDKSDYIVESDIVINSTGNGTLGRVGIIKNEDIFSKKVVPDSHVTLIRIINSVEADYIFYFLKYNQKYLELQATGSTNQTELSPEIIKKILIPLPNTSEQLKIIERIEILLNKIKTAE